MKNIDLMLVRGHEISFEIVDNEKGNSEITAISDSTARILWLELNRAGKVIHSNEKGANGTRLEKKVILGGTATKETGYLNYKNTKVGKFEIQNIRGLEGKKVKEISRFDNGLEVEEEMNSFGGNNQNYMKKVNGIPAFSMRRTDDGITLTRYDRVGNKLEDFYYDKYGMPVDRNGINFPGVYGYETLDSIDMDNEYVLADLVLNDFVQDIGIPIDMRDMVRETEQTRYKETPVVSIVKENIMENIRTIGDNEKDTDDR